MYRFFVDSRQISEKEIIILGDDVNHIKNVLRMEKGECLVICNGQGEDYYCIIDSVENDRVIALIQEKTISETELKTKIYLFQGMPKKDKMELIIQKSVELGVQEIIPVITQRTIIKLEPKKEIKKIERWNAISLSAAKQAKRGIIPKVSNTMSFNEALTFASKELDAVLIPYEKANNISVTKSIIESMKVNSVGIFIGPEGGFEEEEIEKAIKYGAQPISLGKRILRTETAGLTLLSILMYNFEED
ncbi:16S rRNA (uracil1498-N3)-methyltransferase [Natranaerovirga pectinivora]|uniref:Ribosomal RNA small subunit methyltransferase E n=1 Tax=Natranaerovirga pectinivora TaxID=682400 RepID=A0A4R3MNN7_9FIRM|nr:16S rRNA (uracil(1498)-N(3))-methyltransferase [Natranaerovirga pectinivora]TCT16877.1 16S rRNA (uracil1498-N3)-methyltransferase [Natranaerovirga pectinivora]